MRDVEDLRQAMAAATAELAPPHSPAEVARTVRRRLIRRRAVVAAAAAVATMAAVIPVWALPDSAPPPASRPSTGDAVRTGVQTDDGRELVLWLEVKDSVPTVHAGLRDAATGAVTLSRRTGGGQLTVDGFVGPPVAVPGKGGTFIQYGAVRGPVKQIRTTVSGASCGVAQSGPDSRLHVYWVANLPVGAEGTVTAVDGAGRSIDDTPVQAPHVEPTRKQADEAGPQTAPTVGDMIRTGVTTAGNEELVVWFVSEGTGYVMWTGRRNPQTGRVLQDTAATVSFERTSKLPELDREGLTVDGPQQTLIKVWSFVGPVARMTATVGGRPVEVGFARWSARPELVVYWVPGLRGQYARVTAFDAAGGVIGRHG